MAGLASFTVIGGGTTDLAPTIRTQPQDRPLIVGGNEPFSVLATGTAPLAYQWLADGVPIAGATNTTLLITNVQFSQYRVAFSVVVSNAIGTVTSLPASLRASPPSITSQPLDLSLQMGADQIFAVGASGTLPLTYQWRKNGAAIAGAYGPV